MAVITQILPNQGQMSLGRGWQAVEVLVDRLFVPRELILRASGQVTYFRLSSRAQKLAAVIMGFVIAWGAFATASYVVHRDTLAAKDRAIASNELAYQDLETELTQALAYQARLEAETVELRLSLSREIEFGDELMQQREELEHRVDGLRHRLASLREVHEGVIERFSELVMTRADAIETTIAVTGLEAKMLIASIASSSLGRGGPLIPSDQATADLEPNADLAAALAGLNEQWGRLFDLQDLHRSLPLTAPLGQFWVSSAYGNRKDPFTGEQSHHPGVDLVAPLGSGISATAPGRIVFAGKRKRYGRMIEVDHGHGITTRYAHLSKVLVEKGQQVERGQKIGTLGNSGRSAGPHLHYEIRSRDQTLNPIKFLEAGMRAFEG
jgi:murein DD-endopeptidase MepM/ murein hydrolase activator NlpD